MSLLGEIQTKSLHTHRDFYHGCCKLGHVIGPLNTLTKSQKFLKSTQELIYPKEILSGSWWLSLRHSGGKWVSQRKGFSTSCSHLYSIHVQRGVSDFPPVQCIQQDGAVRNWGLLSTIRSWDGKRNHSKLQTGKGRAAALAIQFLRYKKLVSPSAQRLGFGKWPLIN